MQWILMFVPLVHWWTSGHTGTHVCIIAAFYCAILIQSERLLFMTVMDPPAPRVKRGKIGDQTGRKIRDGQRNDRICVAEALPSCLDEYDSPFDFRMSYATIAPEYSKIPVLEWYDTRILARPGFQLPIGHVNAVSSHRTRSFATVTLGHPLSLLSLLLVSTIAAVCRTQASLPVLPCFQKSIPFPPLYHSPAESATSPASSLHYPPVPLHLHLPPPRFPCISCCPVDPTLHNTGTRVPQQSTCIS